MRFLTRWYLEAFQAFTGLYKAFSGKPWNVPPKIFEIAVMTADSQKVEQSLEIKQLTKNKQNQLPDNMPDKISQTTR